MTRRSPDRGLYIHIPFCSARCGYCDFVTFTGKEDRIDAYVHDLCAELQRVAPVEKAAMLSTVFFGGGTPSLLESHHIAAILNAVRDGWTLPSDAEITIEANPESVTLAKATAWRSAGVTRLSLGLQAFDNALLRAMDRCHTVEEFTLAYDAARRAGFDNINVDLIYGFPEQTLNRWKETMERTIALGPEHLSLYALKVESHTPFDVRGVVVDNDLQAEMYVWAQEFSKANGYAQYEISNFSKSGRECRHNLIYWRQQEYIGVGVGAVGCVSDVRWENHKTLDAYHQAIQSGQLPRAQIEALSQDTLRFERLMLGLRLREGLDWIDEDPTWLSHRTELARRHMLEEVQPGRWRIPDAYVALSNQVLMPFVP